MQQNAHVETKALTHGVSRGGRGDQFVTRQRAHVEPCPLHEVRLPAVVGDQDDAEPTHVPFSSLTHGALKSPRYHAGALAGSAPHRSVAGVGHGDELSTKRADGLGSPL